MAKRHLIDHYRRFLWRLLRQYAIPAAALIEVWAVAAPQKLDALLPVLWADARRAVRDLLPDSWPEAPVAPHEVLVEMRELLPVMQSDEAELSEAAGNLGRIFARLKAPDLRSGPAARRSRSVRDESQAAHEVELSVDEKARREMLENAQNLARARPEETVALLRTWLYSG